MIIGEIFINNVDAIFFLEIPEENSKIKTLPWTPTLILFVIAFLHNSFRIMCFLI
jgi:hypothetical protein